jgi:hypothetical protein
MTSISPREGAMPDPQTTAQVLREHVRCLESAPGTEQQHLLVQVYIDLHRAELLDDDRYDRGIRLLHNGYLTSAAFNLIPPEWHFHVTWKEGHPQPDPPVGDEASPRPSHWTASTFPLHSTVLSLRDLIEKLENPDVGGADPLATGPTPVRPSGKAAVNVLLLLATSAALAWWAFA